VPAQNSHQQLTVATADVHDFPGELVLGGERPCNVSRDVHHRLVERRGSVAIALETSIAVHAGQDLAIALAGADAVGQPFPYRP
jgi:hypothetical protein